MRKKLVKVVCITVVIAVCFLICMAASGLMEKIQAYMNYGIMIKYNGEEQIMRDVTGKRVYPISYQGTTYVPIRAVSNMLGIDVEWDGENNTVWLGKTDTYKDFIETLLPYETYQTRVVHSRISGNKSVNVGGKIYNNYVSMEYPGSKIYYNLEGKYNELKLKLFHSEYDCTVKFYGDNEELIDTIDVKGKALPQDTYIDVSGVQQLTIVTIHNHGYMRGATYIVDAKIK